MSDLPKPTMHSFAEIRWQTQEILSYRPCLWQIHVVEAILKHDKDIISIAATGSGKTLTFWMPFLFKKDGIQIVITPLNILGKQNVKSLVKMGIQGITVTVENVTIGLGDSGLPEVPGVLWGPFLDRFLFVVESGSSCLAIQCPSGFLLCYRGLSLSFPPLHMVMRARFDLRHH